MTTPLISRAESPSCGGGTKWAARVDPALDPATFPSREALMQKLVGIHEPYALPTPDALPNPTRRRGTPEQP